MVDIKFPDGRVKQYADGITAMDIAKEISNSLAAKVLAAKVNGQVWDASRPMHSDSELSLLTWDDTDGKSAFWHSSAHLMAEALEAIYPGIKLGIGPPIDNGFYYEVDAGDRVISAEDFKKIESNVIDVFVSPTEDVVFILTKEELIGVDVKTLNEVFKYNISKPEVIMV